jgi:hypothetical protein
VALVVVDSVEAGVAAAGVVAVVAAVADDARNPAGNWVNPKTQIPNPKASDDGRLGIFVFGISWDLDLGIWDLGFTLCGHDATRVDHAGN